MSIAAPVALITHALAYVGPAACAALSSAGYRLHADDAGFADATRAAAWRAAHPGASTSALTDPAAVVDAVISAHGRIDVIVSNDAHPAVHGPILAGDVSALRDTLAVLVERPYRLMRAGAPYLVQQGAGSIVFITSCRTELPLDGGAIPDMARAAANALVRSLAIELAPSGIPVNAIAPNFYASETYFPSARFVENAAGRDYLQKVVPAGRLGQPAEITPLIGYLAALRTPFPTGAIIPFAGGWPAATPRPKLD
ncbi:MAG: SDR family oxidoreductase [Xanthomonadales bacterium]|nr:SDR family oxidoreductase [Xanthomonadales bacterium]